MKKVLIPAFCLFVSMTGLFSQNETTKWYFGSTAAVDFLTGVPIPLVNSVMNSNEGSASIAGAAGNLLFYTNGSTVWNAVHAPMLNGTGLFGSSISCQSAVIVKQPGNPNLYYVFTMRNWTDAGNGCHYSIVDMNLNAGLGDVTTKNQLVYGNTRESLTAVCHANGIDYWIVIHDMVTNEFRSYLLSATGLSALPVITPVGSVFVGGNRYGALKASPNGARLGYALGGLAGVTTEIYDFNTTTGAVSNPIILNNGFFSNAYGIEFSPNSQVLYVCEYNGTTIQQYDLATGVPALIVASRTIISTGANVKANLQAASDGKIYVCLAYQGFLGVINNPNTLGVACGFVNNSLSLSGRACGIGLPNFMPCLLPVFLTFEWKYFDAVSQSNAVDLTWSLNSTHPLQSFSVERRNTSDDVFMKIGDFISANASIHEFGWRDKSPQPGYNEYRIASKNSNGETTFSKVIGVEFQSNNIQLEIFPNPVVKNECWQFRVQNYTGKLQIEVLNHDMLAVYEWKGEVESNEVNSVCLPGLLEKVYYARVSGEDGFVKTVMMVNW